MDPFASAPACDPFARSGKDSIMDSKSNTHDKAKQNQYKASTPIEHPQESSEGTSWQFYVVLAIVGIGILGLIARTIGLF
jgi:hypothetical protein